MADPILTFSGLASGIDWQSMIDQLMKVERRPAALIEEKISGIQSRTAAWKSFQGKLTTFQNQVEGLADSTSFDSWVTSTVGSGVVASSSSGVSPGSYSVDVLRLATAEKVGGDVVASRTADLGYDGEFWINGQRVAIDASDSLSDVASAINAVNTGSSASGVSASVVSAGGGYQLVLTSQKTGATGIDLVDGETGLAASLGFTDGNTSVKHPTSSGARSDAFSSKVTSVATLRGLTGATSDTVTIGSGSSQFTVALNLDQGLEQIAQDITDAAGLAGSSVTASVVSTTKDGKTTYSLDIEGTTAFQDASGVLSTLGVLEGDRGAVSQTLTSGVALSGGAATAATSLVGLDGAQVGDTFTVSGTKPDGTTFNQTLTIAAVGDPANGDVATLGDLLDALTGVNGFDGAATAEIVGGQIVVKDAGNGSSQLALAVVANNEGGGTLDLGDFDVSAWGRKREIVSGADAAARIDGVYVTSSNNTISEAIPGVSLALSAVTSSTAVVTVSRNVDDIVGATKNMVDAYNDVAAFVADQFMGGEGSTKPLQGDSALRGMLGSLRSTLQETLTTGLGGDWTRLGDMGITIQKDGTFSFDSATMKSALEADPASVERLFGTYGEAAGAGLSYVNAGDATVPGNYTVAVTTQASVASLLGADLGGTFDATDDTLTITDLSSGKSYEVALTNGMTDAELLSAVQTELATPKQHVITSATALQSDGLGAVADENTTWDNLYQGGVGAGVQNGDSITISGRRTDGTSFFKTLSITDTATQTLGELKDAITNAVGSGATVDLDANGKFVVTAEDTGTSLLDLSITAELASGTLDLSNSVTQEGRSAARIDASLEGGALKLAHEDYGSSKGFRVEYGLAGTGTELGFAASGTETTGTDVAGTIGGLAATGSGRLLTGGDGTDVEGLVIQVDSNFTSGSVAFERGIAARLQLILEPLLGIEDGSIQSLMDGLDNRITSMNDRIDQIDARLERRRADMIRRFSAMERAMSNAQSQSNWLASTINSLPGAYSSSSSS